MSSFFSSLRNYLPFTSKKFMGKDLAGNKFYELPNPAGGRIKRIVKYRSMRQMNDYTTGQHRLPIQWTAWLSHTRSTPPTLSELQTDANRQSTLISRISEIEARESEERIRQGYALPGEGPMRHSSIGFGSPSRIRSTPSFGVSTPGPSRITAPPSQPHNATSLHPQETRKEYSVPTPTSPNVPPPSQTVDPVRHNDKDDLRRLAEEDTRRRIEQQGGEVNTKDAGVEGVGLGGAGGGLQPRRRGK